MYNVINAHVQAILDTIPETHITDYDWLIQNRHLCAEPEYQRNYRKYWGMNAARLSDAYYGEYFRELQAELVDAATLADLAQRLYQVPAHANGRQSLQFSFATKLLHTVDNTTPIYDSLVASFYFFQQPAPQQPLVQRIVGLVALHGFLVREYHRVLQYHLLAPSIQQFRQQFNPEHFEDQKVIDSLIWAYVALGRAGGLLNGEIVYL